jgi:hypothetical protein
MSASVLPSHGLPVVSLSVTTRRHNVCALCEIGAAAHSLTNFDVKPLSKKTCSSAVASARCDLGPYLHSSSSVCTLKPPASAIEDHVRAMRGAYHRIF